MCFILSYVKYYLFWRGGGVYLPLHDPPSLELKSQIRHWYTVRVITMLSWMTIIHVSPQRNKNILITMWVFLKAVLCLVLTHSFFRVRMESNPITGVHAIVVS